VTCDVPRLPAKGRENICTARALDNLGLLTSFADLPITSGLPWRLEVAGKARRLMN
jgi:hypothetical protein